MKTIVSIIAVACFAVGCSSTPEKPKEQPKPAPAPAAKPTPPPPKPEAKPEVKPEVKPEAKPAPKPKPTNVNVELKIELQGMPFNKAEMTDDNKNEINRLLDKDMANLRTPGSRIGAVIITGHTDSFGSDNYNKKLSERRALAVKDYVVAKGIDPKLIFWEGVGERRPIPVTKFCNSKAPRKQQIECLAPNRRVTVEVVGVWLKPPAKPEAKPETKPEAKPPAKPAATR